MNERGFQWIRKPKKYWVTILYIYVLMSAMGCSIDVDANAHSEDNAETANYSNPIDAYFLPHIENASCEAERRELQDTYRGVWKTEFENVMVWISVESLIETTRTVLITDWLDNYQQTPGSDSRNSWGNGTRSGLNQKEAEIYRDASLKLIDDTYIFEERDYSAEHYE